MSEQRFNNYVQALEPIENVKISRKNNIITIYSNFVKDDIQVTSDENDKCIIVKGSNVPFFESEFIKAHDELVESYNYD